MAGLKVDHINYLIWRYLQESGFGRTAVQLQHEWTAEPQSLSFAHAVNPHELISLVQDGLAYDDISSQVDSVSKRYSFVEARKRLAPEPEAADEPDDAVDEEAAARSRKRPKLDRAADSADRRKRASASKQTANDVDDAMDVDGVDVHVPPKLEIEEPPPLLTTAEIGEEKGVQSRKIYEPLAAVTVAMIDVPNADVMNLCWPVFDGKEGLLATGGRISRWYDSLSKTNQGSDQMQDTGRKWTYDGSSVTCSIIDPSGSRVAYASDDGTRYSVTIREPSAHDAALWTDVSHTGIGTVSVTRWNKTAGRLMYATFSLDKSPELAIFSRGAVPVMTTSMLTSRIALNVPVEDAAWSDDKTLLICGDGLLALLRIEPWSFGVGSVLETDALWSLIKYDEDTGRACCIAPDDSNIALINIVQNQISFHSKTSHGAQITAMEWQPQPQPESVVQVPEPLTQWPVLPAPEPTNTDGEATADSNPDQPPEDHSTPMPIGPRILATAAIDGSIKIWNARNDLICLRTLTMDTDAPAMTLAFSPDGIYIAAAGDGRVCIWLVDEGPEPLDVLDRKDRPAVTWCRDLSSNLDPSANGEAQQHEHANGQQLEQEQEQEQEQMQDNPAGAAQQEQEPEIEHPPFHVLAWNRAGDALAYSEGDKVSTLRFRSQPAPLWFGLLTPF